MKKGLTTTKLIGVVLIIGILVGVAIPIMRCREDVKKWRSEGMVVMEDLADSIRQYARKDPDRMRVILGKGPCDPCDVNIILGGMTHFKPNMFSINLTSIEPLLEFKVICTNPDFLIYSTLELNQNGGWIMP